MKHRRHVGTCLCRSGSVALEYLLVTLFMALAVVWFWVDLFEPGKGYTGHGRQFTQFFQRMLTGVSLPIP